MLECSFIFHEPLVFCLCWNIFVNIMSCLSMGAFKFDLERGFA